MENSTSASARAFSIHYIATDLKAGVTNKDFEDFVREKGVYIPNYPGWKWCLLRGFRGERVGQYIMLYEMESIEARERYVDSKGMKTEEGKAFWDAHPEATQILAEWKQYASFSNPPTLYTDYHVLAENKKSTLKPGPRYLEKPGQPTKARVIGIHNLALCPGVHASELENFIIENFHRVEDYPGWKNHFLKGGRGNRPDPYAVLLELESMEVMERFYPDIDVHTPEVVEFAEAHPDTEAMYKEWKQLASFPGAPQINTDYIAVAESRA